MDSSKQITHTHTQVNVLLTCIQNTEIYNRKETRNGDADDDNDDGQA